MKKLNVVKLEQIKGGGCMKWIRRYERYRDNGAGKAVLTALLDAFDECIQDKYL